MADRATQAHKRNKDYLELLTRPLGILLQYFVLMRLMSFGLLLPTVVLPSTVFLPAREVQGANIIPPLPSNKVACESPSRSRFSLSIIELILTRSLGGKNTLPLAENCGRANQVPRRRATQGGDWRGVSTEPTGYLRRALEHKNRSPMSGGVLLPSYLSHRGIS